MNKIILHEPKGSNVICTKIKLGTNILGLKKWLLISDAINVIRKTLCSYFRVMVIFLLDIRATWYTSLFGCLLKIRHMDSLYEV